MGSRSAEKRWEEAGNWLGESHSCRLLVGGLWGPLDTISPPAHHPANSGEVQGIRSPLPGALVSGEMAPGESPLQTCSPPAGGDAPSPQWGCGGSRGCGGPGAVLPWQQGAHCRLGSIGPTTTVVFSLS